MTVEHLVHRMAMGALLASILVLALSCGNGGDQSASTAAPTLPSATNTPAPPANSHSISDGYRHSPPVNADGVSHCIRGNNIPIVWFG